MNLNPGISSHLGFHQLHVSNPLSVTVETTDIKNESQCYQDISSTTIKQEIESSEIQNSSIDLSNPLSVAVETTDIKNEPQCYQDISSTTIKQEIESSEIQNPRIDLSNQISLKMESDDVNNESSCYQDISSTTLIQEPEIQNPSINSQYDERESLGYRYVTNSLYGISEEEMLQRALYDADVRSSSDSEVEVQLPVVKTPVDDTCESEDEKVSPTKPEANKWLRTKDRDFKVRTVFCDRCNNVYFSEEDLNIHRNSSDTCIKPFACFFCSYTNSNCSTLKLHLAFEHNCKNSYSCHYCSHLTGKLSAMRKHIKSDHYVSGELIAENHRVSGHSVNESTDDGHFNTCNPVSVNKEIFNKLFSSKLKSKFDCIQKHESLKTKHLIKYRLQTILNKPAIDLVTRKKNNAKKRERSRKYVCKKTASEINKRMKCIQKTGAATNQRPVVSYICFYCSYRSLSKNSIKSHIKLKHFSTEDGYGGVPYLLNYKSLRKIAR